MKICLTVDDSKVIRKLVSAMLVQLGFEVKEAENGKEALEVCNLTKPDCILLDWNMPVMDGLAFIKEFRKDSTKSDVKIIFCTSENDFPKIQEAMEAGADEYIMKPFDVEVIRSKFIQTGLLT
jgi:two-component system chemotaxis response regulator CheY